MGFEQAAPCRHRGAPPDDLVNQVVHLLADVLSKDEGYLKSKGIGAEEFERAFPAAIERIRGSWAASNRDRRDFAELVIKHLAHSQVIKSYDVPLGKNCWLNIKIQNKLPNLSFSTCLSKKRCYT